MVATVTTQQATQELSILFNAASFTPRFPLGQPATKGVNAIAFGGIQPVFLCGLSGNDIAVSRSSSVELGPTWRCPLGAGLVTELVFDPRANRGMHTNLQKDVRNINDYLLPSVRGAFDQSQLCASQSSSRASDDAVSQYALRRSIELTTGSWAIPLLIAGNGDVALTFNASNLQNVELRVGNSILSPIISNTSYSFSFSDYIGEPISLTGDNIGATPLNAEIVAVTTEFTIPISAQTNATYGLQFVRIAGLNLTQLPSSFGAILSASSGNSQVLFLRQADGTFLASIPNLNDDYAVVVSAGDGRMALYLTVFGSVLPDAVFANGF
jgi:hypothetical protein